MLKYFVRISFFIASGKVTGPRPDLLKELLQILFIQYAYHFSLPLTFQQPSNQPFHDTSPVKTWAQTAQMLHSNGKLPTMPNILQQSEDFIKNFTVSSGAI